VSVKNKLHNIITINGEDHFAEPGENLLDVLNTTDNFIPQICYNESLGPLQTCDTCIVEVNGKQVRACGTTIEGDMEVKTTGTTVKGTQKEDRKSTRLNSSHVSISYAVFCLKKKNMKITQ